MLTFDIKATVKNKEQQLVENIYIVMTINYDNYSQIPRFIHGIGRNNGDSNIKDKQTSILDAWA